MAKLLCNLCLSKEHNTSNCPRLEERTPPVTRYIPKEERVTRYTEPSDATVTRYDVDEMQHLRDEVERLSTENAALREALKRRDPTNAQRQRAYRNRRTNGSADQRADS